MSTRTARPKTHAFIAASVLVAGFAIATHSARAHGCGDHDSFARVQPADCATLLQAAPAFAWPAVGGARAYTIALTFPDGHVEARSTGGNWFAWDKPVPAGRYQWRVTVAGAKRPVGASRWFVVDRAAAG